MSDVKFVKFKNGFIGDDLTVKEYLLLSYLSSLTKKEYCFASNETLMDACGLAERTLCRVLNSLEEKNLIARVTVSTGRYGKDRKIYVNPTAKKAYHSK